MRQVEILQRDQKRVSMPEHVLSIRFDVHSEYLLPTAGALQAQRRGLRLDRPARGGCGRHCLEPEPLGVGGSRWWGCHCSTPAACGGEEEKAATEVLLRGQRGYVVVVSIVLAARVIMFIKMMPKRVGIRHSGWRITFVMSSILRAMSSILTHSGDNKSVGRRRAAAAVVALLLHVER